MGILVSCALMPLTCLPKKMELWDELNVDVPTDRQINCGWQSQHVGNEGRQNLT